MNEIYKINILEEIIPVLNDVNKKAFSLAILKTLYWFSGSFDSKRIINMMGFLCRNESYGKQFSTKFNRNRHERIKGLFHGDVRPVREIPFNDATKVYMYPTANCRTSSKCKHNIIKHMKPCYKLTATRKSPTTTRFAASVINTF